MPDFTISRVEPDQFPAWQEFAGRHSSATIFHDSGWYFVLTSLDVAPEYWWATDAGGAVRGILPMYFSRSPFTGRHLGTLEGGVLSNERLVADALIRRASERSAELGSRYLLIRGGRHPPPDSASVVLRRFLIDSAGGADAAWESLSSNQRNKIRKAGKRGLAVDHDDGALEEFYGVYARRMRDLGTPVEGLPYFDALRRTFGRRFRLHVARVDGRVVGGMICISGGRFWSWLYGASEEAVFHLFPNESLLWSILQAAASDGAETLDMGASAPESGAATFKGRWATRTDPVPYIYHRSTGGWMGSPGGYRSRETYLQRGWSKLPLWFTNRLGPRLRRSLPFA